jgi:hypothetical protein
MSLHVSLISHSKQNSWLKSDQPAFGMSLEPHLLRAKSYKLISYHFMSLLTAREIPTFLHSATNSIKLQMFEMNLQALLVARCRQMSADGNELDSDGF